jgi:transcriptional regulator GlxA family with amidase domain
MKNILIYLPRHAVAMSATLIKELCWVATAYAAEQESLAVDPGQCVRLVSADGAPVNCFSGNQLSVDIGLEEVVAANDPVDALFLCAFWGAPQQIIEENRALLPWLNRLNDQAVPIAAVSNGPFFLAEAALLDNKVATVYPPVADQFQHRYPDVLLRPERAITDAGNLYCANGIASGCDVTVSIIEMLYGPAVARRISHDFLVGFNRNYSISHVSFDGQKYHRDRQILTAQQWLERNFSGEVKLEAVAADIGMSPRNFSRRFKQATGDSPSHYLQRVRIEAAKELLRSTDLSVAEVAYRVGYADLSYFSRMFSRHEGCLPHSYRLEVE